MLGQKKSRSFNRVDGILTKVRDLKNKHLHPVATLSALSMFIFPREGDQRSRSRSQPSCSWEGACEGEGPLFVSSNGARVESAPWFSFLTMYNLLINRRFPNNNHSFNEKPALVSSWITLSSRSGPLSHYSPIEKKEISNDRTRPMKADQGFYSLAKRAYYSASITEAKAMRPIDQPKSILI